MLLVRDGVIVLAVKKGDRWEAVHNGLVLGGVLDVGEHPTRGADVLQAGPAIDGHDGVEQRQVEAPVVEVVREPQHVVGPRDPNEGLDLGG